MIQAYIIFGSFMFYLLSGIAALFVVGFLSYHRTSKAIATILLYAAVVAMFTNADIVGYVRANWLTVLEYAAGYLAIGTLYMLFRWRMLAGQVAGIYANLRAEFLSNKGLTEITSQAQKDEMRKTIVRSSDLSVLGVQVPLLVRQNKARLTTWLTFWVFSGIEYVLGDLLVNVVNGIVRSFSGLMQKIANKQFEKFSELN